MLENVNILEKLKKDFHRYFDLTISPSQGNNLSGFGSFFRGNDGRASVSTIIPNQLYLGNLSQSHTFLRMVKTNILNSALIVSCLDFVELAKSNLLSEPDANKIKYHVLAMEDVTARAGCHDQIFDALRVMSEFSDQKKPIYIHCFSGVGRSPMMTVLHIAHRYMLNDPVIRSYIDSNKVFDVNSLHPDNKNYVVNLYYAVQWYVQSQRRCCQFDMRDRYDLAISILTSLHQQIKSGQLISKLRDENYCFVAAFVQSPQYKKLQEYCLKSLSYNDIVNIYEQESKDTLEMEQRKIVAKIDPSKCLMKFFNSYLLNKDGWYQQLINALNVEQSAQDSSTSLSQFCNCVERLNPEDQNEIKTERRKLISGIVDAIRQLTVQYPQAVFSQTVAAYIAQHPSSVDSLAPPLKLNA